MIWVYGKEYAKLKPTAKDGRMGVFRTTKREIK